MKTVEYVIIGQGIAGTLVAAELIKRRRSFVVFDADEASTASKITSGLINPVTGRKFIKSWKSAYLLNLANEVYEEVANLTGVSYFEPVQIHRVMMQKQSEDLWLERLGQEEYQDLLGDTFVEDQHLRRACALGVTFKAARINIGQMLSNMQKWLMDHQLLVVHRVKPEELQLETKTCRDYSFEHLIDCSGADGYLLDGIGAGDYLKVNSGERLLVKPAHYKSARIIKANHFAIPWTDSQYWIGSHNKWSGLSRLPSEEGLESLSRFMDQWIDLDYEIISHQVGFRLTSKDRRPVVGTHPVYNFVHFINGLGTKGVSLAPYCVNQLLNWLLDGKAIDPEIDIKRFM